MKNPKKKKLVPIPRLIRLCHAAWSTYVRTRDKRCLMCGTTENLQAHHVLVPKSKSTGVRFFEENGFTLCYREHLKIFHKGLERKDWYDRLKEKIDSMVSLERQTEIIKISYLEKKWTREELLAIIKIFEDKTKLLKDKNQDPPII